MKAKFNITLPQVELKSGDMSVETMPGGNVVVEVEYSLDEMKGLYDLQKQILKELPFLIREFGVNVCEEMVVGKKLGFEALLKDEDFKQGWEEHQEHQAELRQAKEKAKQAMEDLMSAFAKSMEAKAEAEATEEDAE